MRRKTENLTFYDVLYFSYTVNKYELQNIEPSYYVHWQTVFRLEKINGLKQLNSLTYSILVQKEK